jgi:AraC-like DNA-binding protein
MAIFHDLCVIRPVSGMCRYSAGREESGGTSLPILAVPHRALSVEWADSAVGVVRLDSDRVCRIAAEVTGIDQDVLRFVALSPISPALGRYWDSVVRHVARNLLPDEELMSSPLVCEQAFRQLAVALLTVFPNTSHTQDPASGADAAEPAVVRRAVEFIDANAGRDIGIAEIAEASGISARGLQAAFRRHRDSTPLEHLRRVRMERAHRDLQAGDPARGDSVSAIATRWGFTHHGRFAVEYRRNYGCSPSRTLRH